MDKEKKQLIMVGVLVVVFVIVTINNFRPKKKKPAAAVQEAAEVAPVAVQPRQYSAAPVTVDDKLLGSQKERSELPWGRDPFNATINKEYQLADLRLKGISFGQDRVGYAFINDVIVRKGDKVGDYEIMEVEKSQVLLKKGGQSFYLVFPEE